MFLVRPLIKPQSWCNQTWLPNRCYRRKQPRVRIGPDKFELSVDVHSYAHHELKIKAQPDYLLIEGKQERDIDNGYVVRRFAHKFKLPKGCHPERIKSTLSPEGILTIAAKREYCDETLPCETLVPIRLYEGSPEEAVSRKSKAREDPCVLYKQIKIKPRSPDGSQSGETPKIYLNKKKT